MNLTREQTIEALDACINNDGICEECPLIRQLNCSFILKQAYHKYMIESEHLSTTSDINSTADPQTFEQCLETIVNNSKDEWTKGYVTGIMHGKNLNKT